MTALSERFPTPFYAYDLELAQKRVSELLSIFPEETNPRLLYSFKSNPLPALARAIREAGAEADLTSPGEIEAATAAGFEFSKALFGGPGNGAEEIDAAIASGVRRFSIESWQDYEVIGAAAARANVLVQGLLRVNPAEPPKAKLAMSGVASQFGFEEEDLLENGSRRLGQFAEHVAVEGIHIYWGTQVGGPEELAACFENAVQAACQISETAGFPLKVLNFGGGFPWPYAKSGEGPDLQPLRAELKRIFENAGAAKEADWWFESGRYCSASSGTLVSRVMDIKDSKDRRFVILDTGIHHLGGMSGLGRIPRFAIDLIPPAERTGELQKMDIVGQLCTPLDLLGRNQQLPEDLQIGDLVTIPNVGAYGVTGSLTGFLSRPTPLEICHRGGEVESIFQIRRGHGEVSIENFPQEPVSEALSNA
ncbi:MAG: type III PLP-dependent enzyme [Verrucomicrobiales bacterium]|nr:type III PLP-dependent enzyme [Verrucomicrobiales bacterium]